MGVQVSYYDPDGLWPLLHSEALPAQVLANIVQPVDVSEYVLAKGTPASAPSSPAQRAADSTLPSPVTLAPSTPYTPIAPCTRPKKSCSLPRVDVSFVPFADGLFAASRDPLRRPFLWGAHVAVITCPNLHAFKHHSMAVLEKWHAAVSARKGQQRIILYVVASGEQEAADHQHSFAANVQNFMTADAVSPSSASAYSSSGALTPEDLVLERIESEFGTDSDTAVIRIWLDQHKISTQLNDKSFLRWDNVARALRTAVFKSFWAHAVALEDDISRSESQALLPGWNFSTYFILKESLAISYNSAGLDAAALSVYTELTQTYRRIVLDYAGGNSDRAKGMILWLDSVVFSVTSESLPDLQSPKEFLSAEHKRLLQSSSDRFRFEIYIYIVTLQLLESLNRPSEMLTLCSTFVGTTFGLLATHEFKDVAWNRNGLCAWLYTLIRSTLQIAAALQSRHDHAYWMALTACYSEIKNLLNRVVLQKLNLECLNATGPLQILPNLQHIEPPASNPEYNVHLDLWKQSADTENVSTVLTQCDALPDWSSIADSTADCVQATVTVCAAMRASILCSNKTGTLSKSIMPLAADLAALLFCVGKLQEAAQVLAHDFSYSFDSNLDAASLFRNNSDTQWTTFQSHLSYLATMCTMHSEEYRLAVIYAHHALTLATSASNLNKITLLLDASVSLYSGPQIVLPIDCAFAVIDIHAVDDLNATLQISITLESKVSAPVRIFDVTMTIICESGELTFKNDSQETILPHQPKHVFLKSEANFTNGNFRVAEIKIAADANRRLIYCQSFLAHPHPPIVKLWNKSLSAHVDVCLPDIVYASQPQLKVCIRATTTPIHSAKLRIFSSSNVAIASSGDILVSVGSLDVGEEHVAVVDLISWISDKDVDLYVDYTVTTTQNISFNELKSFNMHLAPPCDVTSSSHICVPDAQFSTFDDLMRIHTFTVECPRSFYLSSSFLHSDRVRELYIGTDCDVDIAPGSKIVRALTLPLKCTIPHYLVVKTIDRSGKTYRAAFAIPSHNACETFVIARCRVLTEHAVVGQPLDIVVDVLASQAVALDYSVNESSSAWYLCGLSEGSLDVGVEAQQRFVFQAIPLIAGNIALPCIIFKSKHVQPTVVQFVMPPSIEVASRPSSLSNRSYYLAFPNSLAG